MSILKQNAQAKKKQKENTVVITTRIQKSIHERFKNYCDEYGFSINEALKLLIENELKSIQTVYNDEAPSETKVEAKPKTKQKAKVEEPKKYKEVQYHPGTKTPMEQWEIELRDKFRRENGLDENGNLIETDENDENASVDAEDCYYPPIPTTEDFYGKVPPTIEELNKDRVVDPNDPIEKAIREMEERSRNLPY